MAKKGRKKSTGEKKVPRVEQLRQNEKRSRRNSWMTSLITIGVVILLSVFWYITSNNNGSWKFQSQFDAFTCELPDSWVDYDFEETLKFDGALGRNTSHAHLFAPKSVDIGIEDINTNSDVPTLKVDPEFLETLEKNQGGKASPALNKELADQLKGQIDISKADSGQHEIDLYLTVLTAAIFSDEKSEDDIKRYINGIGGIDDPVEYYLTKLESDGTKIPGVEYGYYKLLGDHPTGIIKTDNYTIIFDGMLAEKYENDFVSIFESIKIP